ncbi:MAG: GGDEF domain-containing protein [Oscillospiraceae bacterium]|nr:GGDEF domain-containing protein [Oscillospiraceae bacterium]
MKVSKSERLTFASLALALANDYSSIYVIDPVDDSYVEYTADGDDKKLIPVSSGSNFFEDVPKNCRELVWKDDQEYFLAAFRKETFLQALQDGRSFSLTYRLKINGSPRYFFLKTIRANDKSVVIGIQDIHEQKQKELLEEAASRKYSEIAGSLAGLFEVIYYIDVKTGQYTEYGASENFAKLGLEREGSNFFRKVKTDMRRLLHPDDCQRMMDELRKSALLKKLKEQQMVTMNYRHFIDGEVVYMQLLAFRPQNDDGRIVIGVLNVDAQTRRDSAGRTYSHIAEALAGRYEVIYYVDVDSNEYIQYSASEQYSKLGTTQKGDDFFADTERDIKKYVYFDDMPRLLAEMQKPRLMNNLAQSGFVSINYRQLLGGRQQYMNMTVVHPKNDEHHIILGVLNTDLQVRRELSMKEMTRTFNDIAMALAQRYEVIYHVNIITNEYTEYSASEKYTKLKVGMKGKDFFRETRENMQHDIYPEDLPMMLDSMKKSNLLKSLSEYGKTFLTYRLMLDGSPQYVSLYAVRPKEDSEHIIIAVANVDAAKRMELAYKNALDMANTDALTGVLNKRAYVQAEIEMDQLIDRDENPDFAIVICDVNGLKQVNDTRGHHAGDEHIRSACAVICETFRNSRVFRIGGDEFAVILEGTDYENRVSLMVNFRKTLEERKGSGFVLLASGISDFERGRDMRTQDVFERADNLMYDNKQICKEENNRLIYKQLISAISSAGDQNDFA